MKLLQFTLEPENPQVLSKLCGDLNENLRLIEKHLAVEIGHRGNQFNIETEKHCKHIFSDHKDAI